MVKFRDTACAANDFEAFRARFRLRRPRGKRNSRGKVKMPAKTSTPSINVKQPFTKACLNSADIDSNFLYLISKHNAMNSQDHWRQPLDAEHTRASGACCLSNSFNAFQRC